MSEGNNPSGENKTSPRGDQGSRLPTTMAPEDTRLLLVTMKVMADSTWAMAEAARLQAEVNHTRVGSAATNSTMEAEPAAVAGCAVQTRVATETIGDDRTEGLRVQPPVIQLVAPANPTREVIAVNERVGWIPLKWLQELSEEKSKELDTVLKRIVGRVCLPEVRFEAIGLMIREELATVGISFPRSEQFRVGSGGYKWRRVVNASSSDLARVYSIADAFRPGDDEEWYSSDMLRVVQRLMELRGFVA